MQDSQILECFKEVVQIELASLQNILGVVDKNYLQALQAIYNCKGKLLIIGVGKSGYIAQKIAATMTSVGTAAQFLHPTEACHGDLGVITKQDIALVISKSGESEEIVYLLPFLKAFKIPLIAVSARKESTLAKACHHFLWMPIEKEACSMNLVPTSSTLVSLAIGDALAITLMKMKKFNQQDFARFHPAGSLGKRLSLKIADMMLKPPTMPFVTPDKGIQEVIDSISQGGINASAVVDKEMKLLGLITGYNIREVFSKKKDIYSITAKQMMNSNPVTYPVSNKAFDAMHFMKNAATVLNVLPILAGKKLVGILSLQSLIKAGL